MAGISAPVKIFPGLSDDFISWLMEETAIAVVFDPDLNFVVANEAACKQLDKTPAGLIGKCILDLYPEITASKNHRNLMRAAAGETISDVIEDRKGEYYSTYYRPFVSEGKVRYIVVKARKLVA